jgi:hypothetical protein
MWHFNSFLTNLTFMGPCIVRIFQYISNNMQRYTVCYIWKLLYMFQVVPPPIIRSAYNCIYSIWYLSHRYCYLLLSWKSWDSGVGLRSPNSPTIAAASSNGATNTRCRRYSCMLSWWRVEVPPKTCRADSRYNKMCNIASCWIYILEYFLLFKFMAEFTLHSQPRIQHIQFKYRLQT